MRQQGLPPGADRVRTALNAQAQQTANANFGAKVTQLANTFADQSKLNRLRDGMNTQYQQYLDVANDPNTPPDVRAGAEQYNNQLGLLGDSMDIRNVNSIADSYKSIMDGAPNISELLNKQKLAQIRADSLKAIANGRASSQMEIMKIREGNKAQIERDKNYLKLGGGLDDLSDTTAPDYDSYEPQGLDDASFAAILDALGGN